MKALSWVLLAGLFILFSAALGCALLDKGTGVNGPPGVTPPVQAAGGFLSAILSPLGFGWVGTVLTGAANVYAEVRAKRWKDAALETANGIKAVLDKNPTLAPAALEAIDTAHNAADVHPALQDAIQSIIAPPKPVV